MVNVTKKTIGPSDRDFATFTLAEAAVESIATAAFGGTNLVTANGAIVFEADAGTYAESFVCNYALTCDATRNVTFRSAPGGQAIVSSSASGPVIQLTNAAFTTLHGLKVTSSSSAGSARGVELFPASSKTCEGCRLDSLTIEGTGTVNFFAIELQLEGSGAAGGVGSSSHPTVIQNCVEQGIGSGLSIVGGKTDAIHAKVFNCTFLGSGFNTINVVTANDVDIEIVNCINLGHTTNYRDGSSSGTVTPSGSNNFGTSNNAFPAALQGSPYPITATTSTSPGAGDFAIFDSSTGQLVLSDHNDVLDRGIGPSSNGDVPTTGISGRARYGTTAHPGAFATLFGSPASSPLTSSGFNSAEHLNQLEVEAPWIWLYELQTTDDPPKRYRMTNFTESVEFGMNSSGQPLTYSPTPIIHSDVEEGSDGSLPTITITVGHAGPIVASTVDSANGFVGQPIQIMLVSSLDLSASKAVIRQHGEVVAASITPRGIAFRISAFNLYQLQFPPYIFARRRCRWIFGSSECGYNTSAVGAGFSQCEKTLDACRARGDDEVSLGLVRQHPARFGGWPGIPRAGR